MATSWPSIKSLSNHRTGKFKSKKSKRLELNFQITYQIQLNFKPKNFVFSLWLFTLSFFLHVQFQQVYYAMHLQNFSIIFDMKFPHFQIVETHNDLNFFVEFPPFLAKCCTTCLKSFKQKLWKTFFRISFQIFLKLTVWKPNCLQILEL